MCVPFVRDGGEICARFLYEGGGGRLAWILEKKKRTASHEIQKTPSSISLSASESYLSAIWRKTDAFNDNDNDQRPKL
jgi:hypothetical protein